MFKMKFNKKGIGILVEILVIIIFGFLIWNVINIALDKGAVASTNPLKKLLGLDTKADLEKQKEMERVAKELLANAENIHNQFAASISKCLGIAANCICGTIDFTKLNNYYLKLTKEGRSQFLELLNSNKVPVNEKYRVSLGNFGIGSIVESPSNEPVNFKYLLFSKDVIIYNKDNKDNEKLKNRMNKVIITQSTSNTLYFDNIGTGLKDCSESSASFAYIRR